MLGRSGDGAAHSHSSALHSLQRAAPIRIIVVPNSHPAGDDQLQQPRAKSAKAPSRAEWASNLGTVRTTGVILTVIACGFVLWALRDIFTPLVLAVFLLLMIDGLARVLATRIPRFPAPLATPMALALIVAFFALTVWITIDNASQFIAESQSYTTRLDSLLQTVSARFGVDNSPTIKSLLARANPSRYATAAAGGLQNVAASAVFVLIYLGFLMASRKGFGDKMSKLFSKDGASKEEAGRIFIRIQRGVEGYIWVQTVTGLIIAVASGLLMVAVGLPHPVFWSFLIFVASYIPVIGGAVGVLLPPLFAFVQLDGFVGPLVLLVGLQVIQFLVGNVLQPRMQSDSLNLDPVVVLLSLAFWGALWGMVGAFLSTPLTVMAMAVLAEFRTTRWLAVLLSSNGEP